MGFLRRMFGSGDGSARDETPAVDPTAIEAAERAYERDLLQGEQERLDELQQRQLRYAEYAWPPPPQGGERRADDEDRDRAREG